jgi:hypothetical protein
MAVEKLYEGLVFYTEGPYRAALFSVNFRPVHIYPTGTPSVPALSREAAAECSPRATPGDQMFLKEKPRSGERVAGIFRTYPCS